MRLIFYILVFLISFKIVKSGCYNGGFAQGESCNCTKFFNGTFCQNIKCSNGINKDESCLCKNNYTGIGCDICISNSSCSSSEYCYKGFDYQKENVLQCSVLDHNIYDIIGQNIRMNCENTSCSAQFYTNLNFTSQLFFCNFKKCSKNTKNKETTMKCTIDKCDCVYNSCEDGLADIIRSSKGVAQLTCNENMNCKYLHNSLPFQIDLKCTSGVCLNTFYNVPKVENSIKTLFDFFNEYKYLIILFTVTLIIFLFSIYLIWFLIYLYNENRKIKNFTTSLFDELDLVLKIKSNRQENDIFFKLDERFKKMVGFFGPTGTGKTTFFKDLTSMRYSIKNVELNGSKLTKDYYHYFNFLPSKLEMDSMFTVLENLKFHAELNGLSDKTIDKSYPNYKGIKSVDEFIKSISIDLGVSEKLNVYYSINFSDGEKKRLNFIKGILSKSKINILDEPCVSMGDSYHETIIQKIEEYISQGTMVFHITHGVSNKLYLKHDEIALFNTKGQIFFSGPSKKVAEYMTNLGYSFTETENLSYNISKFFDFIKNKKVDEISSNEKDEGDGKITYLDDIVNGLIEEKKKFEKEKPNFSNLKKNLEIDDTENTTTSFIDDIDEITNNSTSDNLLKEKELEFDQEKDSKEFFQDEDGLDDKKEIKEKEHLIEKNGLYPTTYRVSLYRQVIMVLNYTFKRFLRSTEIKVYFVLCIIFSSVVGFLNFNLKNSIEDSLKKMTVYFISQLTIILIQVFTIPMNVHSRKNIQNIVNKRLISENFYFFIDSFFNIIFVRFLPIFSMYFIIDYICTLEISTNKILMQLFLSLAMSVIIETNICIITDIFTSINYVTGFYICFFVFLLITGSFFVDFDENSPKFVFSRMSFVRYMIEIMAIKGFDNNFVLISLSENYIIKQSGLMFLKRFGIDEKIIVFDYIYIISYCFFSFFMSFSIFNVSQYIKLKYFRK